MEARPATGRVAAWRRGPRAGQQTAEFALLLGIVTIAAVAMQYAAQQAVRAGVWNVTTVVLGDPGPENVAESSLVSLDVASQATSTEQGSADFSRVTTTTQTVTGDSVMHDENVRTIPTLE